LASIRHKWGTSWLEYCNSGQKYTKLLLEKSAGKISNFIFCSSVAVYGYPDELPISESTPRKPVNLYGKMKLECEKLVQEFGENERLPYTILQPSIIYGENDPTGMMTRLIKMIYNGSYRTIGSGFNSIKTIYIQDLIDIFGKVGTKLQPKNSEYIITYKKPISINDLVKIIKFKLDKNSVNQIKIPEGFARMCALILESSYKFGIKLTGDVPIIANEKIDTMTKNVGYDISKAKKDLGFNPEVSYEEGLDKLISFLAKENEWKELKN